MPTLTPNVGWGSVTPNTKYVLKPGKYAAPGKVKAKFAGCTFESETRHGAVIKGSQGNVNYDGKSAGNVTWKGVVFSGGGTEDRHNDKAGVLLGKKDTLIGTSGANKDEKLKPFTLDQQWLKKWKNKMRDNKNAKFRNIP